MLKTLISQLPLRDQKIIILRFFRDKTQSEVAETLGVSQVQVSRLENKIMEKIVEVKITKLIDSTKKDDALLMYELISEKEKTEDGKGESL